MTERQEASSRRALAHYAFIYVLIGFYGVQVCPFIEGLTPLQVALPLAVVGAAAFALRGVLGRLLIEEGPYEGRVGRAFAMEWGLMIAAGLVILLYNTIRFDFPVLSGMKVVLGFTGLGFFAASDLALARERDLVALFRREGHRLVPDRRYFPLVRKFTLFAALAVAFSAGIHFLVVNKDLDWMVRVGDAVTLPQARLAVLGEFAFVAAVLLGYMLQVIHAYSRNLRQFFDNENRVLEAASNGDLRGAVPVATNDEFGVMAHHTNVMVRQLLERTEQLQRTQDVTIHGLA
ncbi:MAG TPA: hypothetical protein VKA64_09255, partial [Gammaproteobacteria bacterium]|nr:hypothetical protein [Gammaproteobacteria bacterium]